MTLSDQPGLALFPDAVTERGEKHLREMIQMLAQGYRAEMIYFIQRSDCKKFDVARVIDPRYAERLSEAKAKGLIVSPWKIHVDEVGLRFQGELLEQC